VFLLFEFLPFRLSQTLNTIAIGEPRLTHADSIERMKSQYKKSDKQASMFKTLNAGTGLDKTAIRVQTTRSKNVGTGLAG
jgi:hypothetical protein